MRRGIKGNKARQNDGSAKYADSNPTKAHPVFAGSFPTYEIRPHPADIINDADGQHPFHTPDDGVNTCHQAPEGS